MKSMDTGATGEGVTRRPRFRRASNAPAFRVTNDDIEIIRYLARHRFLRSTCEFRRKPAGDSDFIPATVPI